MTEIDPASTALLLIGFQRDYFDPDGILYGVVEEQLRSNDTLANTLRLIDACKDTEMTMVRTPLVFSEDYGELENPIGILKTIREVEAFKAGTRGAETSIVPPSTNSPHHVAMRCLPGTRALMFFTTRSTVRVNYGCS